MDLKEYPWYEISAESSDEVMQGDIVVDCPIIIPPKSFAEGTETSVTVKQLNAIVMTQSCDLENKKVEIVLVCPYHTLTYFISQLQESDRSGKGLKKVTDNLKQRNYPNYHLLNKTGPEDDFIVVDFRNVYGIHFEYLKGLVASHKTRCRLLPPYREHLSQAFARYFMRVGLPHTIEI